MKVYECAQVLLGSAINAFGLPIDFRVERGEVLEPDFQSFEELVLEFGNELTVSVRNNIIGDTVQAIDFVNENVG